MTQSQEEWYDELEPHEIEAVHRRVSQAEGLLGSALSILDQRGGRVREELAEAYGTVGFNEMALGGAKKIKTEEDDG